MPSDKEKIETMYTTRFLLVLSYLKCVNTHAVGEPLKKSKRLFTLTNSNYLNKFISIHMSCKHHLQYSIQIGPIKLISPQLTINFIPLLRKRARL